MKVLIVDDDRLTVKYISAMMDWGALGVDEVLEAYGKRGAMEIIEKETVDILLCDIEMPRGNGYELLEWMEENAYRIPTLFITSYARFDYAVRAMRMHVVDYILKPVSKVQLTQAVKRAVVLAGEFGYAGIWSSWPIGWGIATVLSVWFYRCGPWRGSDAAGT